IAASDLVLIGGCVAGALLSCVLMLGKYPRIVAIILYLLYLSLVHAGQTFMTFQWDLLLLEAGFLAIFLNASSNLIIWLYRWLVFRFMFLGGVVKIISGDPTWDNLSALSYHFETQPLPTTLAWYAHQFPDPILMAGVAFTLITELLVPFLVFAPRRFRMLAGVTFIFFQTMIILTGNYNFFNLLTISLCIFLFDDAAIRHLSRKISLGIGTDGGLPGTDTRTARFFLYPVSALILFASLDQMWALMEGQRQNLSALTRTILPFRITQNYGPFAVMTTVRREITLEGSEDGVTWKTYQFKYKPGDVHRAPVWASPHQPRLDWQMWFAALSPPEHNPWFQNLVYRLLTNSEPVTGLLKRNPFEERPPMYVRARFYEYRFSTALQRKETGAWWNRRYLTDYYPQKRLAPSREH
ncbi:MAG: lipase maturation factor family protein, partial [Proteobacteria bacterium]|nr:lipase maturation factor family protein [Pseudomonadota bacterium]